MTMPTELHDLLERISDETSFLAFAEALLADRIEAVKKEHLKPSSPYGSDANGWENQTIETFLEAAIAWAKDTDLGVSQKISASNPWKRFGVFLYCGKIYE
jgi:hypothetical protein